MPRVKYVKLQGKKYGVMPGAYKLTTPGRVGPGGVKAPNPLPLSKTAKAFRTAANHSAQPHKLR